MKPISLQVPEGEYEELEAAAEQAGKPLIDLVRQLLADYLARRRRSRGSILDIAPHSSGHQLKEWSRSEVLDEMLDR